MNTAEAKALREKLETDIFQLLKDFKKITGLNPVAVEVVSQTVQSIERRKSERILYGVQVEVVL